MKNKVSVIIPTYNSSKTVKRSIESVLNQTHQNFEIIITDDNSNDNTVSVIEKYLKKHNNIKLFCLDENRGAGYARNFCTQNASGDYIAFLDSDDYWDRDKLKIQLLFMKKFNISFSHTSYYIVNEKGIKLDSININEIIRYKDLLKSCDIGLSSVIMISKF